MPDTMKNDQRDFAAQGEPAVSAQGGTVAPAVNPAGGDDLESLRRLIFKKELAVLESIQRRLDDPAAHASDVSGVIAEAILIRARKDGKLALALEPMVESIFQSALRKHPREFASALFPVMGPAIRGSVAETFRSMLESLHKSLETSFSWKGLRWRLEALRTGKPFAEIVLLHTLIFRVEQIFFIHGDTGLVLAHAVNEGVVSQDADMVSAMLTAIQDFVRDCFTGAREGTLDALRFGDAAIIVERSPEAYIACVVRGAPPLEFREKLRANFELMLFECACALHEFTGDTAPFAVAQRYLQDCLCSRFMDEDAPLPFWIKALPVFALLAIAAFAGVKGYRAQQQLNAQESRYARLEQGLALLRREPGIIPLNVRRSPTRPWEVFCLRDEFARPYDEVLREGGLDPAQYSIQSSPQVSYDHDIILKRATKLLAPPESASLSLARNGTLTIIGTASLSWILRARHLVLTLHGVASLNDAGLVDPRMQTLRSLVAEVENSRIEFLLNQTTPTPEGKEILNHVVDALITLEKLAQEMRISISLAVYGYTDAVGTAKRNYELSRERAATLAAMLYARGSSIPVATYGMGVGPCGEDAPLPLEPPSCKNDKKTCGENATPSQGTPSDRCLKLRVATTFIPSGVVEEPLE
jgi:OOP family OmpA-OmpF porin